jgi:hypothetical protein
MKRDMFDIESIISDVMKGENIHIIMNPPFSLLTKTFDYYLELKTRYKQIKSISLLHRTPALEGQRRHDILDKHNSHQSLILNMTKRKSFNTYFDNKVDTWTPMFGCVWSIWDNDYDVSTKMKYIKG